MRKTLIAITIILLVLTLAFLLYFLSPQLTGRAVEENLSTHTKAICEETLSGENIYCEDYEITCEGGEVTNSIATGFATYHDANWKDPRGEDGGVIGCG